MFRQRSVPQRNFETALPPPLKGFRTSQVLTAMDPQAAVIAENFLMRPDGPLIRNGYVTHITAIPLQADRLFVYAGLNGAEKLFGSTAGGIYDFSTAGACPAASVVLTNGEIVNTAISTGANAYMFCVNGVDTLKQYDGAAWTPIAAFAGTATPTQQYSYVETYRQRIYFVKRNSLEIEYLPPNAVAAASVATNYPLGALFRLGGYIVAMSVWTIDGGIGPEDNLAVITNKGEVAVFAGNDPATWSLRGVYFAGRPMGKTPMYKYGGDVLIISETGIIPLSSLIQSAAIDRVQTVSSWIRQYLVDSAQAFPTGQGWQIISDPLQPFLMVNTPATPVRKQVVMHSESGAWSTYSGWNAIHFARRTSELYFSDSTGSAGTWTVKRVTGWNDAGVNITATILQAYNRLGYAGNKKIEEIRAYFESTGAFTYNLGVSNNFSDAKDITTINPTSGLTTGIWGTSLWGSGIWSGTQNIAQDWQTPADEYAMWKALYVQVVSRMGPVSYLGSDLLYKRGGNF